jgi:hypothetical protein
MFDYQLYFQKITPKNQMEIYNRFLFAFCSVHVNWQSNIRGYLLLKDSYHNDKKELEKKIKQSGLGLINIRTKAIYEFTLKYIKNPQFYLKYDCESWQQYEDRLRNDIYGLGFAKTAFAIELIYPTKAEVVCTDVWILRWAKQPSSVSKTIHLKVKQGFLNHCKKHKILPIEMRWKMWDGFQNKSDPRYWSYVLE